MASKGGKKRSSEKGEELPSKKTKPSAVERLETEARAFVEGHGDGKLKKTLTDYVRDKDSEPAPKKKRTTEAERLEKEARRFVEVPGGAEEIGKLKKTLTDFVWDKKSLRQSIRSPAKVDDVGGVEAKATASDEEEPKAASAKTSKKGTKRKPKDPPQDDEGDEDDDKEDAGAAASKILMRGEQYGAAGNLKHVVLHDNWRWENGTLYLDASCLCYGFDKQELGLIDYSKTIGNPDREYLCASCKKSVKDSARCSSCNTSAADGSSLQHSGDVLNRQNKAGDHTIHVHLDKLGPRVQSLWFTLSGWTTMLHEIKFPRIRFAEANLDTELCRYDLQDKRNKEKFSCVIMCVLYRLTPKSNWQVRALGHLGQGRASNYGPIRKDILDLIDQGTLQK